MTLQDTATYECVATNAAGEARDWLQVVVTEDEQYNAGYQGQGGGYQDQGGRYDNQGGGRRAQ